MTNPRWPVSTPVDPGWLDDSRCSRHKIPSCEITGRVSFNGCGGGGLRGQPFPRAHRRTSLAHHRGLRPKPHAVPGERCAQRARQRQPRRVDSGVVPGCSDAAVGARAARRLGRFRAAGRDRTPGDGGAPNAHRQRQEIRSWAGDARPGAHRCACRRCAAEVRARHGGEGRGGAPDARDPGTASVAGRRQADSTRTAGRHGRRRGPDARESQSAETAGWREAAGAAPALCRCREPGPGPSDGRGAEQGVVRRHRGARRRRDGRDRRRRQARTEDANVERGWEADRQRRGLSRRGDSSLRPPRSHRRPRARERRSGNRRHQQRRR